MFVHYFKAIFGEKSHPVKFKSQADLFKTIFLA